MIKTRVIHEIQLKRPLRIAFLIAASVASLSVLPSAACTNILVGRDATEDGCTYVAYSCDECEFAAVRIEPAARHQTGTDIQLWEEADWGSAALCNPGVLGSMPQVRYTYRYIDILSGPMFAHIGGMNEHGVSIAETTIYGVRPQLANQKGWLSPFSTQASRGLMSLGLQRAKTAREAICIIGDLATEYGYNSIFPQQDGEQLAISDGVEVWSMEIFGPGPKWTPGSSKLGAVWCAQRIPDGHISVSANRSRIGEIDPSNPDYFLASSNVYTLAEDMNWWSATSGNPFVWYEVYAPQTSESSRYREWRVLDRAASSLKLTPSAMRFPFSVKPDSWLLMSEVSAIQRDMLEGTPYDPVADPGFLVNGKPSSLACPIYWPELYSLLSIKYHRTVNRTASHTCIFQANAAWPTQIRGCTWFGFGQAATSCHVPIYSTVTQLPDDWGETSLTAFDDSLPFWSMQLPGHLAVVEWQNAYANIKTVRDQAEAVFLTEQAHILTAMAGLSSALDPAALLNEYTLERLNAAQKAFEELADYLLLAYYYDVNPALLPALPVVKFVGL